ncbi:FAD-dependent oxidoreductase [Actinopolymorpha pittospori]
MSNSSPRGPAAAPSDARPDELDVAQTLERLNDATDLAIRSVVRAWTGPRTLTPDRLPAVGFDPDVPGLMWPAGQGGFGIQIIPSGRPGGVRDGVRNAVCQCSPRCS